MNGGIEEGSSKVGALTYTWSVLSVIGASLVSFYTIFLHLKNYRRPDLQRLTIRILLMYISLIRIPIYGFSSLISLSSHRIAFFVDSIRDIYEGFVVYSFFVLLINYLDGERAILELLQHRLRIHHMWPFYYCMRPMDVVLD